MSSENTTYANAALVESCLQLFANVLISECIIEAWCCAIQYDWFFFTEVKTGRMAMLGKIVQNMISNLNQKYIVWNDFKIKTIQFDLR